MLKYRICFPLYFLLVGVASSQEPSPTPYIVSQAKQPESPRAQEPPKGDQRGTEQSPLVVKIQPPNTQVESEEARQEHDNKAAYDWDTVLLSFLTVVVGGLTFVAIVVQAFFLWRAVRVSERAANAAQQSANAAQQSATSIINQFRAYVSIGRATYIAELNKRSYIVIDVSNTGQTPAYELTITSHRIFAKCPILKALDRSGTQLRLGTLGPGGHASHVLNDDLFRTEEAADLKAGTFAVFIYGRTEYKDAFQQARWTDYTFACSADFPLGAGNQIASYTSGNDSN